MRRHQLLSSYVNIDPDNINYFGVLINITGILYNESISGKVTVINHVAIIRTVLEITAVPSQYCQFIIPTAKTFKFKGIISFIQINDLSCHLETVHVQQSVFSRLSLLIYFAYKCVKLHLPPNS